MTWHLVTALPLVGGVCWIVEGYERDSFWRLMVGAALLVTFAFSVMPATA